MEDGKERRLDWFLVQRESSTFTHVEAKVLWIACIELPLEGDVVVCHPQQLTVLRFILVDVCAIPRGVRVLLIEFRMSDYWQH